MGKVLITYYSRTGKTEWKSRRCFCLIHPQWWCTQVYFWNNGKCIQDGHDIVRIFQPVGAFSERYRGHEGLSGLRKEY